MTALSVTQKPPARPFQSELLHFSRLPVAAINDAGQSTEPTYKPDGFWVSVGTSWLEWCHAESFGLERAAVVTRVVLAPDANVLRLDGARALDEFTKQFGMRPTWQTSAPLGLRDHCIDWSAVAAAYDGIVIAPYCYQRRFDLMWYYGWDCASGVIWNLSAIAGVDVLIEEIDHGNG